MEVSEGQIFNLWDTNGRRSDILNAIQIYLSILKDLDEESPDEIWANYPSSLKQYLFYKEAICRSPEIFKDHSNFDNFEMAKSEFEAIFFAKQWDRKSNPNLDKNLDSNIEARSRHYTSNLVRLGFADDERKISIVGKDFLHGKIKRDSFEESLPLSDLNIILLRQLFKLRIYTKPNKQGIRYYYSPCLMAFYLMLKGSGIDKNLFKHVVQGTSPYWSIDYTPQKILSDCRKAKQFAIERIAIPKEFCEDNLINEQTFSIYIKNRKSGETVNIYYEFYEILHSFSQNRTHSNFDKLKRILLGKDSDKLKKAFGCGDSIFDIGTKNKPYSLEEFLLKNDNSLFLQDAFNKNFYSSYHISKYIDTAYEYSDTTMRLLSATGIFKFGKALPELNYKSAFSKLFENNFLEENIFGFIAKENYELYEDGTNAFFRQNNSTLQILGINPNKYAFNQSDRDELKNESKNELEKHIEEKYTREKTLEILKLFSNRSNDATIKKEVNDQASVPTIYEYMVAIAWYYISGKRISVYDSLNLTLNGDMEPVIHAAGGAGDIVVNYSNRIVMLEVTLMNAASQKRGEWEPVLRHTVNLNTENENKKVITLFIADELDYNTINIWRAVSAVPLQASNSNKKTDKVVISAFKNEELCNFLENGISDTRILNAIENSYSTIQSNFDTNWRGNMLNDIQASYKA